MLPECLLGRLLPSLDPAEDRGRDARYRAPPRTEPNVPDSGIRLPPWVIDGKALVWPGMKDSGFRKPGVDNLRDPFPRHAILLAAPPKRAAPKVTRRLSDRLMIGEKGGLISLFANPENGRWFLEKRAFICA